MTLRVSVTFLVDHDQDEDVYTYTLGSDVSTALEGLSLTDDHHAVIDGVETVTVSYAPEEG